MEDIVGKTEPCAQARAVVGTVAHQRTKLVAGCLNLASLVEKISDAAVESASADVAQDAGCTELFALRVVVDLYVRRGRWRCGDSHRRHDRGKASRFPIREREPGQVHNGLQSIPSTCNQSASESGIEIHLLGDSPGQEFAVTEEA